MDIKFERRHVEAPDINDIYGGYWDLDACNESLTIIQFNDCDEGMVFFIPHAVMAKAIQNETGHFAVAWDEEMSCYVFIEASCPYILCEGGLYAEEALTVYFVEVMENHLGQNFEGYAVATSLAGILFYVQTEEE